MKTNFDLGDTVYAFKKGTDKKQMVYFIIKSMRVKASTKCGTVVYYSDFDDEDLGPATLQGNMYKESECFAEYKDLIESVSIEELSLYTALSYYFGQIEHDVDVDASWRISDLLHVDYFTEMVNCNTHYILKDVNDNELVEIVSTKHLVDIMSALKIPMEAKQ